MKIIPTLATVAALGLAAGGFAFAQNHGDSSGHHGASHGPGTAAHLAALYAKVAPFDANRDAQLDGAEQKALAKALADRSLALPAHTAPDGSTPEPAKLAAHVAAMYAHIAVFDTNRDSVLDAAELEAAHRAHSSAGAHR